MKLREKILTAAMNLFNRLGCQPITTNHLIKELGISPGTLYYHFKNKEEIIRTIFKIVIEEFDNILTIDNKKINIENFAEYIKNIYRIYYKYRFFFIDIAMLLNKDPLLRGMYRKNLQKKQKVQLTLLKELIAAGILKNLQSENELITLLHNLWSITDFWYTYTVINYKRINLDCIQQGIAQFYFFIKPYLVEKAIDELSVILKIK